MNNGFVMLLLNYPHGRPQGRGMRVQAGTLYIGFYLNHYLWSALEDDSRSPVSQLPLLPASQKAEEKKNMFLCVPTIQNVWSLRRGELELRKPKHTSLLKCSFFPSIDWSFANFWSAPLWGKKSPTYENEERESLEMKRRTTWQDNLLSP